MPLTNEAALEDEFTPMDQLSSGLEIDMGSMPPTAPSGDMGMFGGGEELPEGMAASGVELAADDSPGPEGERMISPGSQVIVDEVTVREAARFGVPSPGIVGTITYWLKVRERLKALALEHGAAIGEASSAIENKRNYLAELGRKGYAAGITSEEIAPLVAAAALAEGELKGTEKQKVEMESAYRSKVLPLEEELAELEAGALPLRENERLEKEQLAGVMAERRKLEGLLKRAEIELRNAEELIEKRQEAYADLERPKEERAKLLEEISEIDNRRPGLLSEVSKSEKELEALAKPAGEIEARLAEIQEILGAKTTRINEVTDELNALEREHHDADGEVARKQETEASKVEVSWAAVGDKIIVEAPPGPTIVKAKAAAQGAVAAAVAAEQKVDLLTRAKESYDHEVVRRAKLLTGGVAAGIVILLIVLAVVL